MKPNDLLATQRSAASCAPAARQRICTYGVIDTLIARRCINAENLFELVEARSGLDGFAKARLAAQQALEHGPFSLQDIYRELGRMAGVEETLALDHLMQLEVQIELENVLPIAEHVNALPSDALLISDSYLPHAVIREMLRHAGVHQDLPLLLSSHGQASGDVWRTLTQCNLRCFHVDGESRANRQPPAQAAVVQHTTIAQPTAFERMLLDAGARELAQCLRAGRLRVTHADLPDWALALQQNVNLPFLLVSAADLLSKTIDQGARGILFCSRSGRKLQTAFEALSRALDAGQHILTRCWYTCSEAGATHSPGYRDYCRRLFTQCDWIADVCASGAAVATLLAHGDDQPLQPHIYAAMGAQPDGGTFGSVVSHEPGHALLPHPVHSTFGAADAFLPSSLLQHLNLTAEGIVLDVACTAYGDVPIRDTMEYEPRTCALIQAQDQLMHQLLLASLAEWSPQAGEEFLAVCPEIFGWLKTSAAGCAPHLKELRACFGEGHPQYDTLPARSHLPQRIFAAA